MAIKPSDHGIVVESKESGLRYAISDKNYNPDKVRKVRDLRAGETVHGYRPKKGRSVDPEDAENDDPEDVEDDSEETERAALLASGLSETEVEATMQANAKKTEGSAPAASKDAK